MRKLLAALLLLASPAWAQVGQIPWFEQSGPALAPAYYVATTGNDSNPGTVSQPFATIGKAQSTIAGGGSIHTIYVRAGTYSYAGAPSLTNCLGSQSTAIWVNGVSDETISYYPPDGVDSAVIDGGNSSTLWAAICVQHNVTGNHVSIIGLKFQNWDGPGVIFWGQNGGQASGNNNLAKWNIFNNVNNQPARLNTGCSSCAPVMAYFNFANGQILQNAIITSASMGISMEVPGSAHAWDNVVIQGNAVINNSTGGTDQGDIYLFSGVTPNCPATGTVTINNNYLASGSGSLNHVGIYLDTVACNVNATQNVMISPGNFCVQYHGVSNGVFTGNLCDMGAMNTGGAENIVFYQQEAGQSYPMSGNVHSGNFVACKTSATCGNGYVGSGSPIPNPMTIASNGYHNYGTGTGGVQGVNNAGSGGAGTETGAQAVATPQVSCPAVIAPGSPLLAPPISMSQVGPNWGPPGFNVLAQGGVVPSWCAATNAMLVSTGVKLLINTGNVMRVQ